MQIGVAFFDDPEFLDPDERPCGWYSVGGSEARRFAFHEELASDVVWVTNAEYKHFAARKLYTIPNLRNTSFLGSTLSQICADLRLSSDDMRIDEILPQVSKVADRIWRLLLQAYGQDNIAIAGGFSLSSGVRTLLLPDGVSPVKEFDLRWALQGGYQKYSRCNPGKPPTFVKGRLRYPNVRKNRLAHVREVLETPIPAGQPTYLSGDRMGGTASRRLDWLYGLNQPFLVRATITGMDEDAAPILGFNAMKAETGGMIPREWMTSTEAIILDSYSTVTVHGAWIWPEISDLQKRFRLPAALTQDAWMELSYSAQIAAEIHLGALTAVPRRAATKGGGLEVSPMATWLAATDRLLSFEMAKACLDEGITPVGYGTGAVVVRLHSSDDEGTLNSLVRDAGWVFPLPFEEPAHEH